jgi:hypothetical protein
VDAARRELFRFNLPRARIERERLHVSRADGDVPQALALEQRCQMTITAENAVRILIELSD